MVMELLDLGEFLADKLDQIVKVGHECEPGELKLGGSDEDVLDQGGSNLPNETAVLEALTAIIGNVAQLLRSDVRLGKVDALGKHTVLLGTPTVLLHARRELLLRRIAHAGNSGQVGRLGLASFVLPVHLLGSHKNPSVHEGLTEVGVHELTRRLVTILEDVAAHLALSGDRLVHCCCCGWGGK